MLPAMTLRAFLPLQSWEEEEAEAYAMFEAVLQRQAARPAGAAANAAAKKLERNKARMSAAASTMQLERQARRDRDGTGAPLSAAQRKLARNKALGGGMGAGMRASLGAVRVMGRCSACRLGVAVTP